MATFQKHWRSHERGGCVYNARAEVGPAYRNPSPNKEPPLREGVHLRTAAVVEPASGKRGRGRQHGQSMAGVTCQRATSSYVDADGSEEPRLQAVGKVPTVVAMGSRAPKGERGRPPSTQSNRPIRRPPGRPWCTRAHACQGAAG